MLIRQVTEDRVSIINRRSVNMVLCQMDSTKYMLCFFFFWLSDNHQFSEIWSIADSKKGKINIFNTYRFHVYFSYSLQGNLPFLCPRKSVQSSMDQMLYMSQNIIRMWIGFYILTDRMAYHETQVSISMLGQKKKKGKRKDFYPLVSHFRYFKNMIKKSSISD